MNANVPTCTLTKKILIIDDDADFASTMQLLLEQDGFEVEIALSGPKGLEKAGEYDLVLLDLRMPGMNGIEVMKKIKGKTGDKPVIVVTGMDLLEKEKKELTESEYIDDLIEKPTSHVELVKRINLQLKKKAGKGKRIN
jgi:DNA-binding response OmpR family regulator